MTVAASTIAIPASKLMQDITLRVRFMGIARARMWMAAHIVRLAAWVAGCQIEVSIDSPADNKTENAYPPGAG